MKDNTLCNDKNRTGLVEKYLLGGMSEKTRQSFEAHLKHCDKCLGQLNASRKIIADIRRAARKAGWDPDQLDELSTLYARKRLLRHMNWRLISLIALGLCLVVVLPFFWWANKPETRMALLVSLERERTLDPTITGEQMQLSRALSLHMAGKDERCAGVIADLVKLADLDAAVRVNAERLYGLSLMFQKKPQHAVPHLQRAAATTDPDLEQRAHWYLANAFLLLGDAESARTFLNKTLASSGPFQNEAADALQNLEKIVK